MNEIDLERKLEGFRQYYNRRRVLTSLDGDTPSETTGETTNHRVDLNQFQCKSHCRGLFQLPGSSTFRVELGKKAMPAYPEFQA